MKAISLWQPWATLMALGAKQIETRSWSTSYRGPLLICAAKKWNSELANYLSCSPFDEVLEKHNLKLADIKAQMGHALCSVRLVDCKKTESVAVGDFIRTDEFCFGNYDDGRFAWMTDGLVRFEKPIPIKGEQGIFAPPQSVIDDVMGQWAVHNLKEIEK